MPAAGGAPAVTSAAAPSGPCRRWFANAPGRRC